MTEVIDKPETTEEPKKEREKWKHPSAHLFNLSTDEVRKMYELGDVGVEQVRDYKMYQTLRDGGLYDMSEDQVRYAYSRDLIEPSIVANWKDFQQTGDKTPYTGWASIQLFNLAMGLPIEHNNGELETPEFFMDPTDIAVDFATGGINTVRRAAWKGGSELVKKAVKEGGKDILYGRVAAAGMDAVSAAGGGVVLQMIGGFTSPVIASSLAQAGRRSLIDLFRSMRVNNKEVADKIEKAVADNPADPLAQKLKEVLEELDQKGIWQESDVRPKDGKGRPDTHGTEKMVASKEVFDDLLETDGAAKLLDDQLGSEHIAGYTDKLLERIRSNGMNGVEIMESINDSFEKYIKKARNTTTDKAAEAKVQNHIKKLSNNMGMEKVKTEKLLQFAHDAKMSMRDMNIKARVINESLMSYNKQLDEFLDTKIFNTADPIFSDVLEAMEHIRNIAQLQEAFYGIRGEFGRGLRIYRNDQMMKHRFDFVNMPRMDYEALKAGKEKDMLKALRHYRDAKTPKAKNRRARNLMKNRFLKGVLEFEQASLLFHWKTQAVNILGSGMAAANEMAVRYASINWRAWKETGGWRKPFTRDAHAMLEWKLQKQAWKQALVDTLRVEGGWKGLVMNPKKAITSPEAGKAWKAFLTAEPQLDYITQMQEVQGALPDYLKIAGMKMPFGKVMRLPFHGLTAGDEIFKGIGYRMELNRQLYREAISSGATDESSIRTVMSSIMENGIPMEMHEAAMKQARYQTFTDELGSGALGKFEGVMNTKAGLIGRILYMPFIRVTINLPKFALQQTPLGVAAKWQRDTLKAAMKAGATMEQKQAAMEIYARWALGTAVLSTGIALHQNGMITGRTPRDQREIHQAAGVQPYSWVFDKDDGSKDFVDFNRIDPHAFLFGIGADLSAAWDQMQWYQKDMEEFGTSELDPFGDVIMAYLIAFTSPLMEKTIAKSAKEGVDFWTDPEDKDWAKHGRKQLAKFFPRALDMFHEMRGADEVMREARSVMELFWKKVVPENAPEKRHIVYGDIVHREDRVAGLLNRRNMKDDPVMDMLLHTGTNVKAPAQKGTVDGVPWEMTNEQYDEYLKRISESGLKEALQQMVSEIKASGTKDDAFISDQLRSLISTYRSAIRTEILYDPQGEGGVLDPEEIQKIWQRKADAALGKVVLRHKTARNYNWLTE